MDNMVPSQPLKRPQYSLSKPFKISIPQICEVGRKTEPMEVLGDTWTTQLKMRKIGKKGN